MNKKGISPLISTLLLIFFATALGVVVMSWGKTAQLEEMEVETDEITCSGVGLDVLRINEEPQLCFMDGMLKYTLENTGSAAIDSIKLFIIGDEIEKLDIDNPIEPADIVSLDTSYQTTATIKKVKITPSILIGLEKEFCPKKGVEIDSINECGE